MRQRKNEGEKMFHPKRANATQYIVFEQVHFPHLPISSISGLQTPPPSRFYAIFDEWRGKYSKSIGVSRE